ncbi:competence protein ComK [Jeotgalibacillus haloalkalitolerans]|uniref:Competence protein ComK n=1 Tax=Jeotgalibacillus haloalkalitolerans TaxID=3104292 RepID=A0ABU5KKR2_9BACL|nr:competence protein ComK [Jeotgalibacillus sp. HH7-29]MDZ5711331.1 competence protein ComK [Jeotgalibacillus sp. HH7-29]
MKDNHVDYEINQATMAIRCARHLEYQSHIIETGKSCYSAMTSLQLLDYACKMGGSTYKGRQDSVRFKFSFYSKIPILVNQNEEIIMFPTHSPTHIDNIWISLEHFDKAFEHAEREKAIVRFTNGEQITVMCSLKTLSKQHQRASALMLQELHFPRKRMVMRMQ